MNDVRVYSTCPQSKDFEAGYLDAAVEAARWSERVGLHGMLIYSDNSIVDPWTVTQAIISNTDRLRPLVAVQPVYMHPYAVAKKIASLASLFGRAVDLNMIAGGFRADLRALGDDSPHDDRYVRLFEYTSIIQGLLAGKPTSHQGKYYSVHGLSLRPSLPQSCQPNFLVSGSSEAGRDAAQRLGITAVEYPEPLGDKPPLSAMLNLDRGIRVGIIARSTAEEAWAVAFERFPDDKRGQMAHRFVMAISDSTWHKRLSELSDTQRSGDDPYWLGPFNKNQTFCPYLVGTHERVAMEITRFLKLGFRTIILDIPREEQDLQEASEVIQSAWRELST